ncbi:MAG: hypothetical protein ACLFQV_08790 [Vulcanimicrobiota bacterium]
MLIFMADTPVRKVRAEEIRQCKLCKKDTIHRYEEISFHASVMFVKVFCIKKRFARICSECNYGEELTEEQFKKELKRLNLMDDKNDKTDYRKFEISKKKGVKFCHQCGERIYPDVGYCTSCAVRSPRAMKEVDKPRKPGRKKTSKPARKTRTRSRTSRK